MKFYVFMLLVCVSNLASAESLRVMSYNVQNLFDSRHDELKDDWTFLPLSTPGKAEQCEKLNTEEHYKKDCLETDWTPEKLKIKLSQIDRVVKSLETLPDMLALVEVENADVVDMLRKKLGYEKFVITNSPDKRGVDVALLFNTSKTLRLVDWKEHVIKGMKTRNILEVNFKVNGTPFSIYVNHWPSQAAGPESREKAANRLLEVAKDKLANPESKLMMVGDFNVADPEPFPLTKKTGLVDVYKKLSSANQEKLPPGTFFYGWNFKWNRLDRVIVNEGFLTGTPYVRYNSFKVYTPAFLQRQFEQKNPGRPGFGEREMVPWKYWHNAFSAGRAGYSDHFPVMVDIEL